MQLKGSQTEKNLEAALAGESIARNKYTFYSDKAKADGYEQIAELFEETAKNEKAHAQIVPYLCVSYFLRWYGQYRRLSP